MSILAFIDSVTVQTAVYWNPPKDDGYGTFTYANASEIKVRWDDKREVLNDVDGVEIVSRAEILVHSDSPKLVENGLLWLGSLGELTPHQKVYPEEIEDAYPIKMIEKTPLFQSTDEFVRTVYL